MAILHNTQAVKEEILKRLNLPEILNHYAVKPGRSPRTYHCPFHEDKHPSFSLNPEENRWSCHTGCGYGNVIDFIKQIEGIDNKEAFKQAAQLADIKMDDPKDKIKNAFPLSTQHQDYLLHFRGIKSEIAIALGLKSRNDSILFPQFRKGEFVGYKRRNILKKHLMGFEGPDRTSKLWPNDQLEDIEELWFVSGEYEACRLIQAFQEEGKDNYTARTSSTGEQSIPGDLIQTLNEITTLKRIHILYDNDEAGKKGAYKLAKTLKELKGYVITYIHSFPEDKPEKYDLIDFFMDGASLNDVFNLKYELSESLKLNSLKKIEIEWTVIDSFKFKEPESYMVRGNGVSKVSINAKGEPKMEAIAPKPVLILSRAINTDEKNIHLELAFKIDQVWEKLIVERGTISDSRKILELSEYGFPVHSGNARKLIEYLHAFENINLPFIETVYLTHTNGWKTFNNHKIFSLGSNIIGIEKLSKKIAFKPEVGFEGFINALRSNGSFDQWKATIQHILERPRIAFALYASFATPLLAIVDAPNFIIHYWGDSSMGKTTTLEIAASVWGNPSREGSGLVTSWNNTQVFVERIATFFNDLPLCLDDCQTTDDRVLSKVLYMIANSVGRGRGSKYGGIQSVSSWRTICFSTGEKQLTDSTQYDGARARTIELAGSPFGRNQGHLVNTIKSSVRENYGHAGISFMAIISDLLNAPDGKLHLKEQYRIYRDELAAMAEDEIGDRIAHYFAVVWLAAELVEEHLSLGGNPQQIIKSIFEEFIITGHQGNDMATRALQDTFSFAQANMNSFMGKGDNNLTEYFGIWREGEYVAIYPHKLKDFLAKNGFSNNSVLRSWSERGWIKHGKGRLTNKVWFNNAHYRMIIIPWDVLNTYI